MNKKRTIYWLAMGYWQQVGYQTGKKLLDHFQDIETLFEQDFKKLQKEKAPQISSKIWEEDKARILDLAERQYELAIQKKVDIITYEDERYPRRFKHQQKAPWALYFKGDTDLNAHRTVGIVGTRKPTQRGLAHCEQIVDGLKSYHPLIVSGLAYGVDICAHKSALKQGLPTLGIIGSGIDRIYPASHKSVAEEMQNNGGILSQFEFGLKPDREHFPMRNALIAALSDVLIVIESKRKGGSMITAELANDMNKDVFAFPGRIEDECSHGCNHLIKAHKAFLLESIDDIAYITRWNVLDEQSQKGVQKQLFVELNERETEVYEMIKHHKEAFSDQLVQQLHLPMSELSVILLELEFKGMVKSLPGNKYMAI